MLANSVPRLDGPPCTVTSLDQCLSAVGLPQDLHGFLGVISVIPPGGLGYFQSLTDPLLAPALLGLPAWHLASCLFTKLPKFTRTCRDLRSVRLAQQVPCALSHGHWALYTRENCRKFTKDRWPSTSPPHTTGSTRPLVTRWKAYFSPFNVTFTLKSETHPPDQPQFSFCRPIYLHAGFVFIATKCTFLSQPFIPPKPAPIAR